MNHEHMAVVEQGAAAIDQWRTENPTVQLDLRGANLSGADLRGANLRGADIVNANLRGADMINADMSRANLSGANMRGADMPSADMHDADLFGANLSDADMFRANLSGADLSEANLSGAVMSGADLRGANLSGAKDILTSSEYIIKHFEAVDDGIIVYKTFDAHFPVPASWEIKPGSVLTETVNPCRTIECGSGINVSTLAWQEGAFGIWKCLIRWVDLADVVVPYNTDGKIRAGRVTLLEKIS